MKHKGALDGFDIGRKEAEAMILASRVEAGWIKAEDIAPKEEPAAAEETAPETADAGAAAPVKA